MRCGILVSWPGCARRGGCHNPCALRTSYMPLLYRYFDADGMAALRTMSLPASNPLYFNDSFEVRPCFGQDRHDYSAKSHDAYHAQLGVPPKPSRQAASAEVSRPGRAGRLKISLRSRFIILPFELRQWMKGSARCVEVRHIAGRVAGCFRVRRAGAIE
jgi:hypothetical protein